MERGKSARGSLYFIFEPKIHLFWKLLIHLIFLSAVRVELHTRSSLVVSSWNLPDPICHQSVPYTARHQPDSALPTPTYKITGISSNMITAHLDLSWCIILGAAPHLWTNWTPDLLSNDDSTGRNNTTPYCCSRLRISCNHQQQLFNCIMWVSYLIKKYIYILSTHSNSLGIHLCGHQNNCQLTLIISP